MEFVMLPLSADEDEGAGRMPKRTDPTPSRSLGEKPSTDGIPRIGTGLEADILRGAGDGEEAR